MIAYVLIALNESEETELFAELKKHKEVKDVHILFGEYDMIAKIETENSEKLANFVMEKIRDKDYVEHTTTLIIAK